ncbi:MAG TPA: hypothetical protein VID73_05475, partial [Ktedonobacterales bacterium]
MRRAITILALAGPALFVLDNIVYFAVAIAASPILHDVNQVFGTLTNGIFIAFIGAAAVAWVLSLSDAARRQRWSWFALVLAPPLLVGGAAYPLGLTTGDGGVENAALLFALVAALLSLLYATIVLRRG